MSSRLASFRGPSTPSSSPVSPQQPRKTSSYVPSSPSPSSPSRTHESTYHRKVRTIMQELRASTRTWDDLVVVDGLKAATGLVDCRTELENELKLVPSGMQPRYPIVGHKMEAMSSRIAELDAVIAKLRKLFRKISTLVDSLEELVYEAHKSKGWTWVQNEPLWCTWTLEKFATEVPRLLPPYHRSLAMHEELVDSLRDHDLSFEDSRRILSNWVAQHHLVEDGWIAYWEDLCEVEVERWNAR